jgi:isopentenyl-diphosphate delta-isomerase type 1
MHLGFSCYVVDEAGRLLLTRRAASKRTWPGVWTNSCCGHPAPGESLGDAVTRRLHHELGLVPTRMALALSDFAYRAVMANGIVEHELCPVVVAEVAGPVALNLEEADAAEWVAWEAACDRARRAPSSLSPWSTAQIAELEALGPLTQHLDDARLMPGPVDGPVASAVTGASSSRLLDGRMNPIADEVEDVLTKFLDARSVELMGVDVAVDELADAIGQLLRAGGKRLRPTFLYWGHRAANTGEAPWLGEVAAAVEMLHTFALLHDDVMDRSPVRRFRPAAAHHFADLHRSSELDGDSAWFGVSAAVLTGDLAFVWARQLLDESSLPADVLGDVHHVFTALCTEVMAGQYLDLRGRGHSTAGAAAARRVALLKSGRYTITRPLQLGLAATGVTGGPLHRAMTSYGDALGVAFQLRDDVLGVFGDPGVLGKACDSDLREGKRTLLIERALAMADDVQHPVLSDALGEAELSDEETAACRELIIETGALAAIETSIRARRAEAIEATRGLEPTVRDALVALADLVIERDR